MESDKRARMGPSPGLQMAAGRVARVLPKSYLKGHDASWTNARHRAQWRWTPSEQLYPVLGASPRFRQWTRALAIRAIKPISRAAPVTALRVSVAGWRRCWAWRIGPSLSLR